MITLDTYRKEKKEHAGDLRAKEWEARLIVKHLAECDDEAKRSQTFIKNGKIFYRKEKVLYRDEELEEKCYSNIWTNLKHEFPYNKIKRIYTKEKIREEVIFCPVCDLEVELLHEIAKAKRIKFIADCRNKKERPPAKANSFLKNDSDLEKES